MKKLHTIYIILTIFITILLGSCELTQTPKCNHEYTEWVIVKAPTCLDSGKKTRECTICKETFEEEIEKEEHKWSKWTTSINPTCTTSGSTMRKCSECLTEETQEIHSLGHDFDEYFTIIYSTCDQTGLDKHICKRCNTEETIEIPKKDHIYISNTYSPTCTEQGYTTHTCELCNHTYNDAYVESLGHSFTPWLVKSVATMDNDGEETRTCTRCGKEETRIIDKINYIDMSVINFNYEKDKVYDIKSFDELVLLFNASILNLTSETKCTLNYDFGNTSDLLDRIVDQTSVDFNCHISSSLSGNNLTLGFTYNITPTEKTSGENIYKQYDSANLKSNISSRPSNYDSFKINQSALSFNVSTSEQLFYCLEHGVKPICEKETDAEKIYLEAKSILRKIINDDMSDVQKLKAIYEWTVMNVTYDNELLNLLYTNPSNLSNYDGFFLEGVFNRKLAVCEGISKAVTVFANIEGIPCVQITGVSTINSSMRHAWNKVRVDGVWYVLDATSGGVIMNNSYEMLSYETFLISDETMNTKYTTDKYVNLSCDKDYETFNLINYTVNDTAYDGNIISTDELAYALLYISNYNKTCITFQVKIDESFNVGDSITDELQHSMAKIKYSGKITYSYNNSLFTFVIPE